MSYRIYKSYSFVDKDPIVDILRTAIQKEKMLFKDIAVDSGVSLSTLNRWFYGDAKRPQHATVMAVARAIGYDMRLVKVSHIKLAVDNGQKKKGSAA